jgi:collagenase-like PrtC family protease
MHTLDDHDFATINGTQIMSHRPFTAINHLAELAGFGVRTLRLSPQASGMSETVHHFRAAADGLLTSDAALRALTGGDPAGDRFCNGYYHGRQGRVWVET